MSDTPDPPHNQRATSEKKPTEFRRFQRLTRQIIPRQRKPKKSKESRPK